jgi:hypothetical protein
MLGVVVWVKVRAVDGERSVRASMVPFGCSLVYEV